MTTEILENLTEEQKENFIQSLINDHSLQPVDNIDTEDVEERALTTIKLIQMAQWRLSERVYESALICVVSAYYDEDVKPLFDMAFGKRPAEELFDLSKDPYQLNNVADKPEYGDIKRQLSEQLTKYLVSSGDPRETSESFDWDAAEYYMEGDKRPRPGEKAIEALGLEAEYDYLNN